MHGLSVEASKPRFKSTFICSTPRDALDAVEYFRKRGYEEVRVLASSGMEITVPDLEAACADIVPIAADQR